MAHCVSILQGFSHLQSEYQKSIGGSQSPGAPGPGPGPGVPQSHDWDGEYCNRECGNHCRSVEVTSSLSAIHCSGMETVNLNATKRMHANRKCQNFSVLPRVLRFFSNICKKI